MTTAWQADDETSTGGRRIGDSVMLDSRQGEAIVRLVECAPEVRRRHQFFIWSQTQLFPLLPHSVLVCGAYNRRRRALSFEAFYSVVLAPDALHSLTDAAGPLLSAATAAWVQGRGQPLLLDLLQLGGQARDCAELLNAEHRLSTWLLHGVTRPQRPAEVESLFVFAGLAGDVKQSQRHLELVLPHLHSTWQRVHATETERGSAAPAEQPPRRPAIASAQQITDRERQILMWVRDGKTNLQIGVVLGISPLTVKNHVQKILRKMGAHNRAHAVAQAMALNLLESG